MHCGEIYGHYMKKVSGVISALYPDFERKKKGLRICRLLECFERSHATGYRQDLWMDKKPI